MKWTSLPLLAMCFTSCKVATPGPPPRVAKVVLVHGFLDSGDAFRPMCTRLKKRGFDCFTATLKPSDGRGGLEKLAVGLKQEIDAKFGPKEPINIVAFSMGGLVSRYYLQNLGGAKRCEQLITISSPHNGTTAARWYPSQGAKEMRPKSEFLTELKRTERNLGAMKLTSYRTPMDLIILPPDSSKWERADNLTFPVLLHPLMLVSQPVMDDIEKRLVE